MMISPIDGRPHQVGGAGVHPHILLISMLEVEDLGDKASVGTHALAEPAAPQGRFFLKRLKRGLSFALKLLLPGALKRMKFIL